MMTGGLLKFIVKIRKVCNNSKAKDAFFRYSISRITKYHIRPGTRAKQLFSTHPNDGSIWNNTDPCDISLENTSDTKGPVSIDVTKESVKATITPMSIEIDNNINVAQYSVTTTNTPMPIEDDKTWYDSNEESDLWHEAAETMDNYQEWVDPPTILGDTDKTQPINKHINTHPHNSEQHIERLKSNISASDCNTGCQFLCSMFYKFIYFMLFVHSRLVPSQARPLCIYLKYCPRLSPLHLSLYGTGLINHASNTPRNT